MTGKNWSVKDRSERRQVIGPHLLMLVALRPNLELLGQLGGSVPEVHIAGDCKEPFGIMSAVADGARLGRAL